MNSENHSQAGLKRELGFWTATSIVVGCVIGSGVFVKPGKVLLAVGGANLAISAWLIGGLISIAGGLTIAEVAARIPKTGGVYAYIEEIYGETLGFLCGWVQTVIYGPGLVGALSLYFGLLALPLLGLDKGAQVGIALAALAVLMGVNCVGAKYAGIVQEITTFVKLIPIFLVAIFGLLWGAHPVFGASTGAAATGSLGGAVLSTLWAYDGWMLVANVAGEMKRPARDLPRAIIIGLAIVVTAYLSVNLSLLHVLSGPELTRLGEDGARVASTMLFGPWGGLLISLGVLVSIFGSLNGNILSNPRVSYAMAHRRELPFSGWLGHVNQRFSTPINATILQGVLAVCMILLGETDEITDLAIFSIYLFFTLAFAGLFLLRRRKPEHEPFIKNPEHHTHAYRTPLYPFVPMIAVLGCVFMLVSKIIDQPKLAIYFLLITLAGLPMRWLAKKQQRAA